MAVSRLMYGCSILTQTKRIEKKLRGSYTRMLYALLNKSWNECIPNCFSHCPHYSKSGWPNFRSLFFLFFFIGMSISFWSFYERVRQVRINFIICLVQSVRTIEHADCIYAEVKTTPLPNECPKNLTVRLPSSNFGECRLPLHCHRSQVHSHLE